MTKSPLRVGQMEHPMGGQPARLPSTTPASQGRSTTSAPYGPRQGANHGAQE